MNDIIRERITKIPIEDKPISKLKLSGIGNFFGLYGGEHIAATEFVIGAVLVLWGCKATDIFLGLIIGNILATCTYAFICAPIAVDTRLTLYSYLKKVVGVKMQKIYNFVWGIASIAMAASMLTVSVSAVREVFNVAPQTHWYPTDIKFIMISIVLGIIVTVVAANGFEAVAKFSSVCAPWMIAVFFAGALVALPQLVDITGFEKVNSISSFFNLVNTHVWNGEVVNGGEQLGILHVIGFAWMCNLAYHGGLNDMSLFRFAKSYKYGFVSAIGMFVGHFFAWGSAGIMGATAAIIAKSSITNMDSGAVTNIILGGMGLLAVIVAGWTTANPSIYRASLALKTIFTNVELKTLSYIVGIIMTIMGSFPITANIMAIVNIIVLIVPAVGAICIAEHYILPKLGGTRYWTMYKGNSLNYAALLAWFISLCFVIIMLYFKIIHSYFLFLPTYIIAIISYLYLALKMGAANNYDDKINEDIEFQKVLEKIIEEEDRKEIETSTSIVYTNLTKKIFNISYIICGGLLIAIMWFSILTFKGNIEINTFKKLAFQFTIAYFIISAITTYMKMKAERVVVK